MWLNTTYWKPLGLVPDNLAKDECFRNVILDLKSTEHDVFNCAEPYNFKFYFMGKRGWTPFNNFVNKTFVKFLINESLEKLSFFNLNLKQTWRIYRKGIFTKRPIRYFAEEVFLVQAPPRTDQVSTYMTVILLILTLNTKDWNIL